MYNQDDLSYINSIDSIMHGKNKNNNDDIQWNEVYVSIHSSV